jgi:prepilin-type processing-associated H-X9-DG protein
LPGWNAGKSRGICVNHAQVHVAGEAPPFNPAAVPETIVLATGGTHVRLTWPDGERAEISAGFLREACRCAWCTRARHEGTFAPSFDSVAIERLSPIGGYAVNIAFSDGHARGIYPWAYLRMLAQAGGVSPNPAGPGLPTSVQRHDG